MAFDLHLFTTFVGGLDGQGFQGVKMADFFAFFQGFTNRRWKSRKRPQNAHFYTLEARAWTGKKMRILITGGTPQGMET